MIAIDKELMLGKRFDFLTNLSFYGGDSKYVQTASTGYPHG